ncbi:putative RNase H [Trypanosoma cruzi]|uniref:Putative RNase H n=1 Tax=Trypanosoma cruzi TaxID=5693 RepID=A0A2V2X4J9_TRYCR|nr:putative RNase H [Trypanosoma cruzi]
MKSPWSPSCSQQRPAAEFLHATKAQRRDKAQHHRWGPWVITKNSGVDIPTSAGIGILLSSPRSSKIIENVSTNGGTRPCSRTTESRALLPAMERLSDHRIQHRHKNPACGYRQSFPSSRRHQGPAQSYRLDGGSALAASLVTDACRLVRAAALLLRTLRSTC